MLYYNIWIRIVFLCYASCICSKERLVDQSIETEEDLSYYQEKSIDIPSLCGESDRLILESNQHEVLERLDSIKNKIDNLERQQRDFLLLINEIVMKPADPTIAQENRDYQNNRDLMKANQYHQALNLWKKFIQDYPSSEKVVYAYYWMGELYLLENQLELSQSCYQSMIDRYPTHSKTPEAFLKLGQIELKRGNIEKAKSLFRYLIEHYPHSQATTLAKKSLSEMIMSETES